VNRPQKRWPHKSLNGGTSAADLLQNEKMAPDIDFLYLKRARTLTIQTRHSKMRIISRALFSGPEKIGNHCKCISK